MNIKEEYHEFLQNWKNNIQQDEHAFSNINNRIILCLTSSEAFQFLPEIIDLLLEQKDYFLFGQLLDFFLLVIRKTDTTEMPIDFQSQIEKIENRIDNNDHYHKNTFDEIKRWYHIQ